MTLTLTLNWIRWKKNSSGGTCGINFLSKNEAANQLSRCVTSRRAPFFDLLFCLLINFFFGPFNGIWQWGPANDVNKLPVETTRRPCCCRFFPWPLHVFLLVIDYLRLIKYSSRLLLIHANCFGLLIPHNLVTSFVSFWRGETLWNLITCVFMDGFLCFKIS